jgi:uncharacterized glyoxalase superfamily protein PhnB
METVLAIRPFVPARDFDLSKRFYQAIGFALTYSDDSIAFLKLNGHSVILQKFYVQAFAENLMLQALVRDVDAWWTSRIDAARLVADFGVKPPQPPAMQSWGMKVGFIFDPSGVLWHIAETPF